MALNIKNSEVEKLAEEVARLTGESKTEAIRRSLLERKQRLVLRTPERGRGRAFLRFLETEIWPRVQALDEVSIDRLFVRSVP